jgi:hypothetical protein
MAARTASARYTDDQERPARTACSAGDHPVCLAEHGERRLSKSERADAKKHTDLSRSLLAKQGAPKTPAGGNQGNDAKRRAAKKACLNGDLARGVELLTDLYVDTNDPTYIFNQGRCYEQNNRCKEAIVRFREYLRKIPDGMERDRADAEKHIGDCEALLAKERTVPAAPPNAARIPEPATPQPPAEPSPSAADSRVPADVVEASPQGQAQTGSGLRTAGVLTMGAGGAFLIAGAVLNLKHNSTIHGLQGDYSTGTANSAQSYRTWSIVGYGAGAACLVGGAVLYWLGRRAGTTVVMPDLRAGQAGVVLAGEL